MSLTIVTKNDVKFFTNINSEQLIGKLCKKVGAKYHDYNYYIRLYGDDKEYGLDFENISIPFDMTNDECIDAANKLRTLLPKADEIYPEYKHFFSKECTSDNLKSFIIEISDILESCGGYECLS